ncbi:hypothetical protein HOF56_03575 [Candidatus Peribacteria bacterium]|jgi:hypothetical protein|nr:hypothetical protein [Candidatus Peribacteria bacterium]MBT4021009.1 hypothetical protein [Candidatus Peribacteria bacterium]MBT4240908.1 hypothetical protein [Candidatus Peribacteria bacterium]MBT4474131.1 hypothetical protein [Candidatus Peribacteria bacterium]
MKFNIIAVTMFAFFLVGCDLTASIIGGGAQEFSFAPTYMADGESHSISVTFTVENDVVTALAIEPGGVTGKEIGKQLAFSANIRKHVLEKELNEIDIPQVVGNEAQLTEVFRGLVVDLLANSI